MCAIIGWSGQMPVGLLYQLFYAAEKRGRDSSGMAYWDETKGHNLVVKHAVRAAQFVNLNTQYVNDAQHAPRGIAHTRRASSTMPINNFNAHPFVFDRIVFAHNGIIKNWKTLREQLANAENADKTHVDYASKITTDSMVLGPAITNNDFSQLIGCFGLTWICGHQVFALRSKKELTGAVVEWNKPNSPKGHKLALIASTWEIIEQSFRKISNVKYEVKEEPLQENTLYELVPGEVRKLAAVTVHPLNHADTFTSGGSGGSPELTGEDACAV